MDKLVKRFPFCRFCKNKKLIQVIDLGSQPAANAFLNKKQLSQEEDKFPLKVNFCSKCGQLQLTHVVSPDLLFRNYVYVSSTSPVFIKHFEDYAKSVYKKLKLGKDSFVIDIGSNDGILLRPFKDMGTKILGVDPAREIARKASEDGIETLPEYFDQKIGAKIIKKYRHADVITANNVFAHVPFIDELIMAVRNVLKEDGVLIIEAPYLADFLQKNLFDTIYHEHVSYLSIRSLTALFKRFDMKIFDVEKTDSHGGSIRVFVKKIESRRPIQKSVANFISKEKALGLGRLTTYTKFAKKIDKNKEDLNKILKKLKSQGYSVIGYGAPAKGNTMLNYFNIGTKILDYIIDDSKYKQGLYTPGTHIPVVPSDRIYKDKPDYILILAWNFAPSIMKNLETYKKVGGKFILPVPKPAIV